MADHARLLYYPAFGNAYVKSVPVPLGYSAARAYRVGIYGTSTTDGQIFRVSAKPIPDYAERRFREMEQDSDRVGA